MSYLSKYLKHLQQYALLMRLHRPIGILLLLWPTLWALWIAGNGKPDVLIVTIFVLGVIVMRSAGCVINDIADRNFDGLVARTKDRPIANKKISVREAFILFVVLCLCAFILVLFLNRLTILLALVGLALTIIYPFTKRYIALPQLFLGFAFDWGVPMAFAAQTNSLPAITWLVFLIAILWTIIYDTMYAMVDKEDDLKIGIKSTAILFGQMDRFVLALLQFVVLILFVLLGEILQLKIWYYFWLIFSACFFIYQQYLIKDRNPQRCFKAFLNNQWVGLFIFVGLLLAYL